MFIGISFYKLFMYILYIHIYFLFIICIITLERR
nr:MAG TPA: protein of unknown function (DUF334) [Caudoviricetes sp.]